MRNLLALSAAALAVFLTPVAAHAATATDDMQVSITITNECTVNTTDMNFGSNGVLDATLTASAQYTVICTKNAAYSAAIEAAPLTGRVMSSTGILDTVSYSLSGDTLVPAALGTGSAQVYNLSGSVPVQATPPAGTYTDTVTITVTYP